MTTIKIRNIGPIKEVEEITLNRVNVFMGPQSSGKSTIAKIISYCTWVEKDVATGQPLSYYTHSQHASRMSSNLSIRSKAISGLIATSAIKAMWWKLYGVATDVTLN